RWYLQAHRDGDGRQRAGGERLDAGQRRRQRRQSQLESADAHGQRSKRPDRPGHFDHPLAANALASPANLWRVAHRSGEPTVASNPSKNCLPEAKGSNQVIGLRQFLSREGYRPPSCVECVGVGDMTEPHRPRVKYVIGPDGSPLTIADLPAPGTKRWVIRRKAEVVAAVRGGLLSLEEACSRYTLTVEEFLSWQYSIDQHGLAGLRTTRIQQSRQ